MEPKSLWPMPSWLRRDALARWRIWDCLFVPAGGAAGSITKSIETMEPHFDAFAIERLCTYFPVGMATVAREPAFTTETAAEIERCLARWPRRLLPGAVLNAAAPERCMAAIEQWFVQGPMVAALFTSSAQTLPCTHPNFEKVYARLHELGALIVQHTWFKNGGKGSAGESTPDELAEVARRHPEITFVCVHAGGEWEKGLRAIRDCGNVLVEISGFDPTAGFLEMAVREIGAKRVLFARERSFATELAKVLGAEVQDEDRALIFGGNLRRVLGPVMRRKGWGEV